MKKNVVHVLHATLPFFAVLFPLSPLFFPSATFSKDWQNHLWAIRYIAESLRVHAALPTFFHTQFVIGLPNPVFYAPVLYPVLGFLSLFADADLVLRLTLLGLWVVQFYCVRTAARCHGAGQIQAGLLAFVVCVTQYPLATLYHTGAVPEVIATTLLTCAVSLWLCFSRTLEKPFLAWSLFLVVFACGCHAITAVAGTIAFAFVGLLTLPKGKPTWLPFVLLSIVLGICVLAPWAYVTFGFLGKISISAVRGLMYDGSGDQWWNRLFPFSVPAMTGNKSLGTRLWFSDNQLNAPLLMLVAFTLWKSRKRIRRPLVLGSLAGFVFFAVVSTCFGRTVLWTSERLTFFQMAYRMITYQNLFLLTALLGLGLEASRARVVWSACLLLVAINLGIKLPHAWETAWLISLPAQTDLTELPETFYGMTDYLVRGGGAEDFQPADPRLNQVTLNVGRDKAFGEPGALLVKAESEVLVRTNVGNFPWNVLTLDGHEVPEKEKITAYVFQALRLSPGMHQIGYREKPDWIWRYGRPISLLVFAGWLIALVGIALAGHSRAPVRTIRPLSSPR